MVNRCFFETWQQRRPVGDIFARSYELGVVSQWQDSEMSAICCRSDSFSSKGTVSSRLRRNERRVRPKRSELTLRRTTDQRPVESIAHAAIYRETQIFARRHP